MTMQKRTSVLVVEDEGIIAQNLRELLFELDYDAYAIAPSADDAVARASERCPDVVLMDIRIKGRRDGIDTAAIMRDRFDVPVVYLTAHADDATLERAKRTEPFGYLVKPVKPQELRSALEIARYKHAMERRLRARERWFATTMQSIADAIVAVDLAGKVTFLNAAAEKLLGVALAQAQGRSARELLRLRPPAGGAFAETPLEQVLRERRAIQLSGAVLETGAGSERFIADSAAPVMDNDEMLGAVMVIRDVTEQRQLEQRLEISDRLASLGTMAAGVAHEINNPLAVILGNAEFVLEKLQRATEPRTDGGHDDAPRVPAELAEAVKAQQELLSAVRRAARIVSDLKTFSRPEGLSSTSVDIRDAIEWAVRATAHEFRQRARVTTELGDVPRVDADATRLGQVFVNLLVNAAQAITPGNAAGNEVSLRTRTDDAGRAVVEVSDSGCGIAPAIIGRVFEPFFTTKPIGVGTGLGLSICHGIVASMGGQLQVASSPGEGTTFTLTLPAGVSGRSEPAPASGSTKERRGRLLLIDDEEPVLKMLSRVLRDHEVVTATDAREALARLEEDDAFDVILCDMMMPGMTGRAFHERLLALRPEAAERVVFMTGGVTIPEVSDFLHAAGTRSIEKPFDPTELRKLVQRLLATRQRAQSTPIVK
jgi:PAS domain S-box-containing protein